MATHDYVIANGTGAAVRSDLNDALAAIVSNNSGSSEPATTYAYQWWADTTNNVLKIRNSANNAWITLRELDGTMLIEDGSASAPGLSFASDTNSGLFGGSDTIGFATGGNERLEIGSSEVVFNDPSNDVDFRVESNGQTHMLFVDAGNDRIGIAENSPSSLLSLGTSLSDFKLKLYDGGDANDYGFGVQSGVLHYHSGGAHVFEKGGSEKARIDSSGRLLVGSTSARENYFSSASGQALQFQIEGTDYKNSAASFTSNSTSAGHGPHLAFGRSRGTAIGSNTLVNDGDTLGAIVFHGNDASKFVQCARIDANVDGTPGSDDMPGRLIFQTTADGANSPTERVRIDSKGRMLINDTAAATDDSFLTIKNGSGACEVNIMSSPSHASVLNLGDTGDYNIGRIKYEQSDNSLQFHTNNSERARLDSSGRLLVGTTSSKESTSSIQNISASDSTIFIASSNVSASGQAKINFGPSNNITGAQIICVAEEDFSTGANRTAHLDFVTRKDGTLTRRFTLTSIGSLVGGNHDTEPSVSSATQFNSIGSTGYVIAFRNNATPLYVGRNTSDGTLVDFRQNGTAEGSISVSGSTVSYNGGHLARWSQLSSGAARTEILRGSVLSNLDEMCEWGEEDNEQLNRMKVSDVEGDVNVSGVFQAWDDDDDTYTNDFYCAMTGDFVIRIAQGTTVARGDLLMSAGDGTAKPQDDDIVRSKTIAKVTSTTVSTTYSDGSYCVPCVLMAC